MQGRNQFNSEVGGRKGQLWKVSFPMKRFHYFASEHQKNVLSKALWLLEGVICAFQGFAEWFKQHFAFAYPHIFSSADVEFHSLLTFVMFPVSYRPKLLAKHFRAKRVKHLVTALLFHVKFVSVWSCLPLQSSPRLVSATWRKTLFYQVVP